MTCDFRRTGSHPMHAENRMGRVIDGAAGGTLRTPTPPRNHGARRGFLTGTCERQVMAETARAITSTDMMNPASASTPMKAFARRVIGGASAGENAIPAVNEMYR